MDEQLKLVTDFAELRAGALVAVKGCRFCEGWHRGMLLNPEPSESGPGIVFPFDPPPACAEKVTRPWRQVVLSAHTVNAMRVYLIDTGLEDTQTTHTAKPKRLAPTLPESR